MYSSRRLGRTLTSMRASSSNACPDTIRSGCLSCIIRFAVPSAILSLLCDSSAYGACPDRVGASLRYPHPFVSLLKPRVQPALLARSTTVRRRAATSQNSQHPPRASPLPRRFPPPAPRIPSSPALKSHPPRFPQAKKPPVSRLPRLPLPIYLSTRQPCAPPSCAPRREFSSAAPGRSREWPARVPRRSSRSKFSALASGPRLMLKAAFQKNVSPATTQIHTTPAHLPARGYESGGSLRCAVRPARRTSRAAPVRRSPRHPRPRALDSVFSRRAVREAGQSSSASIAAFPSPVNADLGFAR